MRRGRQKVPTLITALQALEGIPVTIELRSELYIRGIIESVDNRMKYVAGKIKILCSFVENERKESLSMNFYSIVLQNAVMSNDFDLMQTVRTSRTDVNFLSLCGASKHVLLKFLV